MNQDRRWGGSGEKKIKARSVRKSFGIGKMKKARKIQIARRVAVFFKKN